VIQIAKRYNNLLFCAVVDFVYQVSSKDVTKFQMAYCNLLKGNMDGLKKVKKVKGKSTKDS